MKKFFSILAATFGLFAVASCEKASGPEELSDDQIQECFETIRGSYQGTVQYVQYSTEDDQTVVSENCTWSFNSINSMAFSEVSAGILARRIINEEDADLKAALTDYGPITIKAEVTFFSQIPVGFYLTPEPVKLKLTYGGKTHDVEIGFTDDNPAYSCGYYYRDLKGMQMQILESYLTVDGGASKLYSTFVMLFSYNVDSTTSD